ncbi:18292_t:CDS:2, partial [Funneliformis geosporum]
GKHIAFVSTEAVMARALLDCIAYTNTVEAEISFEVTGHFNIVIAITNIATPVHVEALAQMLYQIRDCSHHIISVFYQKNSNELFRPPAFIEVEHQKHLSAKYFIEKFCSLIANTGNRKKIRNEVKVEALVVKETDFNAVAIFWNLILKEAESLKFDQECSITDITDTMILKRFYMQNIYSCKDMSNDNWNNLCKKKQGCNEDSAIEGLVVKDFAQYEDTYFKAENNFEKSVAEDLQKYYSENHWKVIRELFQVLGFTDIDDRRILS